MVDIDDHIDPTTRAWVTVDEEGRLVFPAPAQARVSESGARFEGWFLNQEDLTAEQQRWLSLLGSQIRANAEQWTEVTPDYLAFPPFTLLGGTAKAAQVFGSPMALEARLESLNAAVYAGPTGAPRGATDLD